MSTIATRPLQFANLESLPHSYVEGEFSHAITVRISQKMHMALTEQAHQQRTSLNRLCLTRLLAEIPNCPIPTHRGAEEVFIDQRNEWLEKAQADKNGQKGEKAGESAA